MYKFMGQVGQNTYFFGCIVKIKGQPVKANLTDCPTDNRGIGFFILAVSSRQKGYTHD